VRLGLIVVLGWLPACICSVGQKSRPGACAGGGCDGGVDGGDEDAGTLPDGSVPDASRCEECLAQRTLAFDTSFEFLSGTPVLDATEVDPEGSVVLAGYHTGGLLVTGWPGATFADASEATWDDAAGGEPSGRRFDGNVNRTFGEPIEGVGLAGEVDYALTWEGEVYLQHPGDVYTLRLDADARGFLEVLQAGEWRRVLSADGVPAEGTVENGAIAAWKPIRIAVAVDGSGGRMTLQYSSERQAQAVVPAAELRAAATAIRGLRLSAYDALDLVSRAEESIDDAGGSHDWAAGGPADLGLTDFAGYSLQWTGQVRVDVAGEYAFRVAASGGHRLFVDGLLLLDAWGTTASDETSEPVDLAAGWHDVDLSFESAAGAASVDWHFAAGSVDLAGEIVPADRLRPITGSRPGEVRESNGASYAFGSGGVVEVSSPVVVDGPTGATATTVDLTFRIVHDDQDQVQVDLQSALGTRIVVRDHVAGSGARNVTLPDLRDFAGEEIDGTWRVFASDDVAVTGGTLENVILTVEYRAPLSLHARTGAYTSRAVDLTDGIVSFGEVRWTADEGDGDVTIRTRSCPTAASCGVVGWSAALPDPDGSPADADPLRFVQLRAELTGDGQTTPVVESLEMDYSAYDAECVCP